MEIIIFIAIVAGIIKVIGDWLDERRFWRYVEEQRRKG